jgi:hypothetical protein
MPPAGSKPAMPVNERPQADTLEHAATGVGYTMSDLFIKICTYVYLQAIKARRPMN